nr:hypothetical protein [Tanacetum cinerariifolium]
ARSWSIPSENPYEEAAQQLFEHAPHYPEYVPRDHVPVFVLEFEHPEDLVPAEDEAPASLLPSGFLSPRIRPLSPRALEAEMNAIGSSLYRSLHPSGTPPLPLLATHRPGCEVGESSAAAAARRPGPTMAHGVDCSYVETRLRDTERRMMAALELVNLRVSCQVDVCTRESSEFCTQHHDAQKDRAAVRAEIEVLRSERLAYEQEGIQTREALARSEAYCRALEARRQAADDFVVQHIMCTQTLEAGARDDTLKDTGTEGAIGLTCSIEKMESVFNISGCAVENQDPYEEAAQQLFEQAPHSPEYVPRDHVPVFVPEFEHPEDLVPAEDEAPASLLPPGFLSPRIRPLSPRALGAEINAIASSLYHSLHPSGTPPLLPIPLSTPSTSRRAGIPEADTPPRNRPLLATPRPGCEEDDGRLRVGQPEGQLPVLETHTRRLEWQRQAADDFAVQHIVRTQALEA